MEIASTNAEEGEPNHEGAIPINIVMETFLESAFEDADIISH